MGDYWGHSDRIRESCIHKSEEIPPMRLLIKDHKKVQPGELPSTRPVVNASKGMNVPLSDILSDILEPLVSEMEKSAEVISSEHLLHEVDKVNQKFSQMNWAPDQPPPQLLAADATALYPSLDHKYTAEIIRQEVLKSRVSVEGLNTKELARYVRMTCSRGEISRWKLKRLLPWRKKSGEQNPA